MSSSTMRPQPTQLLTQPNTSLRKRSVPPTSLSHPPPLKKAKKHSPEHQFKTPSAKYTSVANRGVAWAPPTSSSTSYAGSSTAGKSLTPSATPWIPSNAGPASSLPAWTPSTAGPSSRKGAYGSTSASGASTIQDAVNANRIREDELDARYFWVANVQRALLIIEGACVMCTDAEERADAHPRGLMDCPILLDETDDGRLHRDVFLDDWRKRLKYTPSTLVDRVCFRCHIPNGPNDILHNAFSASTHCEYPDYVAGIGYVVWVSDDVRQLASTRFAVNWTSLEHFQQWVVRRDIRDGYPTNMIALFVWYVETYIG